MEIISLDFETADTSVLLKRIHLLTGMTVTLYNSRKYWVSSYPTYNCSYCKTLRDNMAYHMRCGLNDSKAFDLCVKKREMIVYRCYMGLYEIMVPLFDQENICGYLMLGQAMEDSDAVREECCRKLCEARPEISEEQAKTGVVATYAISEEKLKSIAHVAQLYADYISEKNLLKSHATNSLANLVSIYIQEHLAEKITNAELCYVFLCDRKKLTKEFKEAYGMSIVDYTNNLRLHKAKHMICKNPELSISYVSSVVGFTYQSYFSTLFYNKYGMSPTELQRRYRKDKENK